MKLTANFTLDECTYSNDAEKYDIENYPNADQIENIKALMEEVLQPVRDHFKTPIHINSCFRSKELNTKIKGAANSQHMALNGSAAVDFVVPGAKMIDVYNWIKDNLIYDQLINEYNLSWIHVSFKRIGKNRKQNFAIS